MANLQELCLKGEVTDKTLKNLADLKKLHRLDLSWSHGYTDRGLAELVKSLPALKSLVLSCGVVGAR